MWSIGVFTQLASNIKWFAGKFARNELPRRVYSGSDTSFCLKKLAPVGFKKKKQNQNGTKRKPEVATEFCERSTPETEGLHEKRNANHILWRL